jgi:hypothetical protein
MKRALVLSLVVVLGLGVGAFAQLSGSWESNLSFNLGAIAFPDFIVDLTSDFAIDYSLAGWTFGSVSGFDLHGFASQAFSVEGALGAFSFTSSASFAPAFVTVWTYPDLLTWLASTAQTASTPTFTAWVCADPLPVTSAPKFLKLDATASVSIAGVTASAYVLMDQSEAYIEWKNFAFKVLQASPWILQTSSLVWSQPYGGQNGTGAKITLAGSVGGIDVTSYTYFNLTEADKRSSFCPEIGKRGYFYIPVAGCTPAFTEEYVMFEGMTFGCIEFNAALKITCTGFSHLKLVANGIDLGGWATLNIGIGFSTKAKELDLCLKFNAPTFSCITVEVGFGDSGFGYVTSGPNPGALKIDSIQIHGFGITTEVGAVTFTSYTELDVYSQLFSAGSDVPRLGMYDWKTLDGHVLHAFAIPFAGITKYTAAVASVCINGGSGGWTTATPAVWQYVQVADGYSQIVCFPEYRYKLWEMFQITIDEDACCGGLFGVDILTYFGDKQQLTWVAYNVQGAVTGVATAPQYLLGTTGWVSDLVSPGAGYSTGGDPACTDSVYYAAGYADTTAVQLFNWAYTTVEFSVGMGSNLTLNLGAGISAFGWEDLTLGFAFTW